MEIQNQHNLPAPLAEVLGEQAGTAGLPRLIESIGCIAADPPEGALISCPVLQACTGLGRHIIMPALRDLESAGVIVQFTPDTSKRPLGGKWILSKTLCFELTHLGKELVPQLPVQDCKLRNPLIRPTPKQKALIDCARCVMSKVDLSGIVPPGAFTVKQVAECQGLPVKTVSSSIDYTLQRPGLISGRPYARKTWGRGQLPNAYSPTEKGGPWLTPLEAPHCPMNGVPKKETEIEFTPSQQAIVDAIALVYFDLHLARIKGKVPIRQSHVRRRTGLPQGTINQTFQKLVREGYLERRPSPKGNKTDRYEPTSTGLQIIRKILIQADLVPHPDEIPFIFERQRPFLLAIAKNMLSKSEFSPAWAEDILGDCALYVYQRFCKRGDLVAKGDHLDTTLRILTRDRTHEFIRRELGAKRNVPVCISLHDHTDLPVIHDQVTSQALGHNPAEPPIEERALQDIYSEQVVDILARLFLAMNPDQRNAILHSYKKDLGLEITPTSTPDGTLKSRRYHARKKALKEIATNLMAPQGLSSENSSDITAAEAISIALAEVDGLAAPSTPVDPEELNRMKDFVKDLLSLADAA